jgi:hypothetical protein
MRFDQFVQTFRMQAGHLLAQLSGGLMIRESVRPGLVTVTYAASMVLDTAAGAVFQVTVTDNVAFVFAVPINPPPATAFGQRLTLIVRNTSGGAHGAGTFTAGAGGWRVSGNVPTIATANQQAVVFEWRGTEWVEVGRTAGDVPI